MTDRSAPPPAKTRCRAAHAPHQARRPLFGLAHLVGLAAVCWLLSAHAVPITPTGLTATAGNGSVTLQWTQSGNPAITKWEYRYRQLPGPFGSWTEVPGDYRTYMYTVSGLTNGFRYEFELRSVDSDGPSEAASATVTLAQSPTTGVIIPDAALRRAVGNALGKGEEDEITSSDMASLLTLDATSAGIGNLTGLGQAINLHTLKLANNGFADASPLADLIRLETLDLGNNAVSDLTPLSALFALTELHLSFNRASQIEPLAGLVNLTILSLSGNGITNITALRSLTRLKDLNLQNNGVVNIGPLAGMPALSQLNLSRNQIADIAPLVANRLFGAADEADLRANPLDQEAISVHIPTLRRRGATVRYLPSAPERLLVTPGRGEATLTWGLGAVTIEGYEVRHGPGKPPVFGDWAAIAGSNSRTVSHQVDGLPTGGLYTFELRAVGLPGPGPAATVSTEGIEAANQPPRALQDIPDQQLEPGGRFDADLTEYFEDADDETLQYQVRSSRTRTVAASLLGRSLLRVTGTRAGAATVTVTARDASGDTASIQFRVIVGIAVTVADVTAPEGGEATLTLQLTRPRDQATVVPYGIAADRDASTADADSRDHDGTAGVVTIPAGEQAAELTIRIVDDDAIEPPRETFLVTFAEPASSAGYTLAQESATVTIAEGVCDRTPAIRDRLRGREACATPTGADLAAVRLLTLRGRNIAALRSADLLGLAGLELLDLRDNGLTSLPAGLLTGLDKLATLRLTNNRLSTLTVPMLAGAPELVRLNVERNRLANLAPNLFAAQPGLQVLRLSGNQLATLPAGLFAGLSQLEEVDLTGNPGDPFPLAVTLVRTDAASVAPGPATVVAQVVTGMPFMAQVAVDQRDAATIHLGLAAGALSSGSLTVPAADRPVRLTLAPPALPASRCGDLLIPCFRGLGTVGSTLTLFRRPPVVVRDAPAVDLLSADGYGLMLAPFFNAPDGGALTYSATSSDPAVATANVVEGQLVLATAETDDEASAVVTVTATDEGGQAVSFTFTLTVQPALGGFMRGWRHSLPAATSSGPTEAPQ